MTAEEKLDSACDAYARDTVATCETDERVGVGFDLAREAIALLRRWMDQEDPPWDDTEFIPVSGNLLRDTKDFLDGKTEEGANVEHRLHEGL